MRRYAPIAVLIAAAVIVWLAVRTPAPAPAPQRAAAPPSVDPAPPPPNVPLPSPPARTVAPPSTAWIPAPSPSLAKQAEANRRSVEEAQSTGRFPERLSAAVRPGPFDLAAWKKSPQAYLDVVEPGRIYQLADASLPSVKPLAASGRQFAEVHEGAPATLGVRGEPGAPVTFTAFGSVGAFDNGLSSISVKADDKGVANVVFTAAPGAAGTVRILAGSPLTSGQVIFQVAVKLEE